MSLQYIIDAYNLTNHPDFKPSIKSNTNIAQTLLDFIKLNKLSGSKNNRTVLVFDGYPQNLENIPQEKGFICLFSHSKQADEIIKKIVEESVQPRNLIVVSDDKEVQIISRLLHAQVCSVHEFVCGKQNRQKVPILNLDSADPKLSFSKMQKINAELKKKWLT